jgi:hypothetical protein
VQKFYDYLNDQTLAASKNHIAALMVEQRVEPYLHIEYFLKNQHQELLTEWLDSFFKRMGQAWNGFWKNPQESPTNQLEIARQALNDLHHMIAAQGGNSHNTKTILLGLEQSLGILEKLKPGLASTVDVPHSMAEDKLPSPWHERWASLVQHQHGLVKEPDSEEKKDKMLLLDEELEKFWKEIQDFYQSLPLNNPNKQKIKNFLQSVDTDAEFRDVRDLLDVARKRTQNNLQANRPEVYRQVALTWQQLAAKTPNVQQRAQQLLHWYQRLPDTHALKQFIRQDMQQHPELDNNEMNVFWKYAVEWINKFPHHAGEK